MYSEVRELVNFVCRYLFGRVPRRPAGIFAAELGNFLVSQFSTSWDIQNPQHGEQERVIFINCGAEGSSKCFGSCAHESGLSSAEVLGHFPAQIRIYANPGEVYLRASDVGMSLPIWNGDVNADDWFVQKLILYTHLLMFSYQPVPEHIVRAASSRAEACSNLGGAGKPVMFGKKPFPSTDLAVIELVNNMYIPLGLEKYDELNSNLSHIQEKYPYRFSFKPSSSQTYTGAEFSQTRFGSSKSRPDLHTMLNIKQMSSQNTNSCSNFSPSFNEPISYASY
uniref:Anti_prolifrtn domain-containing protein n=1 Tax=Caenorhabditis tropicalis TaxID=1561998 RepID=A0A1I7UYA6_9PELO